MKGTESVTFCFSKLLFADKSTYFNFAVLFRMVPETQRPRFSKSFTGSVIYRLIVIINLQPHLCVPGLARNNTNLYWKWPPCKYPVLKSGRNHWAFYTRDYWFFDSFGNYAGFFDAEIQVLKPDSNLNIYLDHARDTAYYQLIFIYYVCLSIEYSAGSVPAAIVLY